MLAKLTKEHYQRWGIKPDYLDITFEKYLNPALKKRVGAKVYGQYTTIHKNVAKWINQVNKGNSKYGLLFFGENGDGKSTLANSVARHFLDKDVLCPVISMTDLLNLYFKEWVVPDRALTPPVLVIEEVGKEVETRKGHSAHVFEHIIKSRADSQKATILVSNFKKKGDDGLYAKYGPSVESLIDGRYFTFPFPKVDQRKLTKDQDKKNFFK